MQKFQNLSTRTKAAIATASAVVVFGVGVVAAPKITGGNGQPLITTPAIPCLNVAHGRGGKAEVRPCPSIIPITPHP